MQVSSVRGSLHNRCFSGTGSIGGIQLPDFHDPYVFYRKKSGTGNILRIQNPLTGLACFLSFTKSGKREVTIGN
jgi:hypothetical protein